jgi:hypothetical protein
MTMVRSEDDILDLAADDETPRYLIVGDFLDYQPLFRGASLGVLLSPFTHVPIGGNQIDLLTHQEPLLLRFNTSRWLEDNAYRLRRELYFTHEHLYTDTSIIQNFPEIV